MLTGNSFRFWSHPNVDAFDLLADLTYNQTPPQNSEQSKKIFTLHALNPKVTSPYSPNHETFLFLPSVQLQRVLLALSSHPPRSPKPHPISLFSSELARGSVRDVCFSCSKVAVGVCFFPFALPCRIPPNYQRHLCRKHRMNFSVVWQCISQTARAASTNHSWSDHLPWNNSLFHPCMNLKCPFCSSSAELYSSLFISPTPFPSLSHSSQRWIDRQCWLLLLKI